MWWFTFLESLMECTSLWVGTNQWNKQSGSSSLNTGAEKEIEILIILVNEFNWCSLISAASDIFKHMFLFIENFLLLLELSVIICAHSVLIIFRKFSENSFMHKCLSGIQFNNIFCTAERIQHLLNTDTFNSKLLIIINHSFRSLNLADISLLMNSPTNLKLQRRHPFPCAVK